MTKIIISGGGTGGHVFPAIAIATALRKTIPGIEILFTGAKGKLEMEKVPAAGYPIEGLWISGLQRKLTAGNLLFPIKVLSSLIRAIHIIRKFKPDLVIGVGGYASGPTLQAASLLRIPVLIQEQNSFPGITNKILAKKADTICVAYEGMDRFFPKDKLVFTGNPVRKDFSSSGTTREEASQYFGTGLSKTTVLATGGSLGAATINRSIRKCLEMGLTEQGIQFIWQTGRFYYESIKNDPFYTKFTGLVILPFIDRMDLAYTASDIVVSRAGAIAISELCTVGKPAILIPSPNVAEDHQTKNAEALVRKQAALMLRDDEAPEKLHSSILQLQNDTRMKERLALNIKSLALPDAAERIAEEAIKILKGSMQK